MTLSKEKKPVEVEIGWGYMMLHDTGLAGLAEFICRVPAEGIIFLCVQILRP